jgi:hypothetical protein
MQKIVGDFCIIIQKIPVNFCITTAFTPSEGDAKSVVVPDIEADDAYPHALNKLVDKNQEDK